MSSLAKLEFKALDVSGNNYLSWQLDAKLHLQSNKLDGTIKIENKESYEAKAKALIFLRHHIHDDLKAEYLCEDDPLHLWISLKNRFDHQRMVILPAAQSEWLNLRYQDYKTVKEYNSALFNIVSRLRLCGEKVTDAQMIEKTLSTFHATNVLLQQQYRERNFTRYSELVTCLLVAEANSNVLIRNHNSRPTGTMAIPTGTIPNSEANANFGVSRGRGGGRWRGRGRGKFYGRNSSGYQPYKGGNNGSGYQPYKGGNNGSQNQKWNKWTAPPNRGKSNPPNQPNKNDNICHRCGKDGHWFKHCPASYQEAEKFKKSKKVETNMTEFWDGDQPLDVTHLNCSGSFVDTNGNQVTNEQFEEILGNPPSTE